MYVQVINIHNKHNHVPLPIQSITENHHFKHNIARINPFHI